MFIKFLKIFFSILALMLFAFLVNITFYFSNYSKNIDFISSIGLKQDNDLYQLINSWTILKSVELSSWEILTGTFVKNINKIDRIYFSNLNSYDVKYFSWTYEIDLKQWLYFLDLNDLSVNYKIKWLGFEIEPKSAGMIFLDTRDPSNILVFSVNSIFKFVFKSESWRKVNYYYIYPHNYLIFNVKNNKFSRIWWDVFRIKTIVNDGFLKEKLKDDLNLKWFLKWEELKFFTNVFNFIQKDYYKYKLSFTKLKNLNSFSLIWQKYIDKYFDYFINEAKKRVYYKQSILNSIQELYNQKLTSTDVSQDIINKLWKLKEYNVNDYNEVISTLNWYYKIILKNNSLKDKVILDNFLPLIKYIKLVESGEIKDIDDLIHKVQVNQSKIFSLDKINEIYSLSKKNLDYLYLLRNIDKKSFNRIVLNLQIKYKQLKDKNISKNKRDLLNKYYYWVLNLKQWNDDLELYILLKNIYFTYDFSDFAFNLEKYFNDFVNIYFSKLKVVNNEIIVWQHIDIVLLKSFLYYLEDYLNNFAFDINSPDNWKSSNTQNLTYNINILEKYLFLNKYIYFKNNSDELLKTWVFKNKYLLNNILNFIRNKLFSKDRENWLLVSSNKYDLPEKVEEKFSNIIEEFFKLEKINKNKLQNDPKFRVLLEDYDKLYEKFKEYFLALLNYEEYKTKYSKLDSQLDNYKVDVKENVLWKEDIIKFLSQFKWADFSNTEILVTSNPNEFIVKNFWVNGWVVSFKINPEKSYLIYDLIIESDIKNRKKYYGRMYSLEREQILWERNQKYAEDEEKDKYDFAYYFKNKFFDSYSIDTWDYEEGNLRKWKKWDSESLRVFKRDKLLSKTWEFADISDILKLKYDDVVVNDLKNIEIKKAEVISDVSWWDVEVAKFSSKYFIDKDEDKHYFYDDGWIKLTFYKKMWSKTRVLLWGNEIVIDFNIDLKDFKTVFNDIFDNLRVLSKVLYYINDNLWVEKVKIKYNKSKFFVFSFEKDWKKFEFYIKKNKIIFIKEDWKVLKLKNIDIFKDLAKLSLVFNNK